MKQETGKICGILGGIAVGTAAAALVRSEYERHHFTVTDYYVTDRVPAGLTGFKLAVLADLHNNRFGEKNQDLLRAIHDAHPDAVLIAGDAMVVKEGRRMDYSALEELLAGLTPHYPLYYVKGNHEERMKSHQDQYPGWYDSFLKLLARYPVTYLENEATVIQRDGARLRLIGYDLPEYFYRIKFRREVLPVKAIEGAVGPSAHTRGMENTYDILVAHSPLYADSYAAYGADLTVSGHFHGGTIRLPKFGGLMSPQFQFFSGRDRGMYDMGEGRWQITSGGLGTHSIDIRLNNMSELVMITLGETGAARSVQWKSK